MCISIVILGLQGTTQFAIQNRGVSGGETWKIGDGGLKNLKWVKLKIISFFCFSEPRRMAWWYPSFFSVILPTCGSLHAWHWSSIPSLGFQRQSKRCGEKEGWGGGRRDVKWLVRWILPLLPNRTSFSDRKVLLRQLMIPCFLEEETPFRFSSMNLSYRKKKSRWRKDWIFWPFLEKSGSSFNLFLSSYIFKFIFANSLN